MTYPVNSFTKCHEVSLLKTSKRIFALRMRRRLSQRGLAELIGVSVRTLIRWESGESEPRRMYRGVIEALGRESGLPESGD